MRRLTRPLVAAVTLAVSAATAFTGTAHAAVADDCVGDLIRTATPGIEVVTVNDDGTITIAPHGADGFVSAVASQSAGFVSCVVRCVEQFLITTSPVAQVVTFNPDGTITVNPHGADAWLAYNVAHTAAFVNCVL
jgi:hypothetical protein